jgi:hypothetical protein
MQAMSMEGWREMTWEDVPPPGPQHKQWRERWRVEVELHIADCAKRGILNSGDMRDEWRKSRKLKGPGVAKGGWNASPYNKFVNEHAFIQNYLVQGGVLGPLYRHPRSERGRGGSTDYQLYPEAWERWLTSDSETLAKYRQPETSAPD